MKTFIITAVFALSALSFSSCSDKMAGIEAESIEKSLLVNFEECTDSIFTTTIENLTEADIAGLNLMREEEKMAHDVYLYFFENYELTIFDRIAKSESKHADAVLRLLNHFELEDPTVDEAGVFTKEELQSLYNQLTEMGNASVEAALSAGALIEETDIADLQELLENTENADLIRVYTHLLKGSYQHLKAFARTLLTYNITYVPVVLTQEAYDAILIMPNGNGNQGKGIGKGNKGNKGGKGNRGGNGGKGGNSGSNGQGSGNGTGTCVNG